jgi:2-octaprenyl-6-methoxyphenol hydroxylase
MTVPAQDAAFDCDIAVIGAGPVGLALAGALARRSATAGLSIVLVDARDAAAARRDPRVLALSYGSRVLLEPIAWPVEATPIERIHVSQRGHFGRALIDRTEHDLPALGYVVRYGVIADALRQGLNRIIAGGANIRLLDNHDASEAAQDDEGVTLNLRPRHDAAQRQTTLATPAMPGVDDGTDPVVSGQGPGSPPEATQTLRARLLIHAEGGLFAPGTSAVPAAASSTSPVRQSHDYDQTAIVAAVRTTAPMPRMAWERFTEEGPIALLPLSECGGNVAGGAAHGTAAVADYALVWCQSPAQAAQRMALSDADFLDALGQAFGARLGRFTSIEGRAQFPLGLNKRTSLVDRRAAAIGNAAQTLHPVAGQGLNLGLRDAQALAAALGEHGPTPAALDAFARRRGLDRAVTIGMTDALARGFTVDVAPIAALRGIALAGLDLLPGAKSMLARQMMFGQRR